MAARRIVMAKAWHRNSKMANENMAAEKPQRKHRSGSGENKAARNEERKSAAWRKIKRSKRSIVA